MMGINFQNPAMLVLLLSVPLAFLAAMYARHKRAQALDIMSDDRVLDRPVFVAARRHRTLTLIGSLVAMILVCLALARPGWNPRKEPLTREGRDVVFVLDVSRSMLAEDRVPNRLENAATAIIDCVDDFEHERVALVLFSGSATITCPLTRDYGFFRSTLENANPYSVAHGGTRLGDALQKTADKLLTDDMKGFQDIILLTDGGDHQSDPIAAVDLLNEKDASLIVIGIGSENQAAEIPVLNDKTGELEVLMHENQPVKTQQDTELLKAIAMRAEDGLFLSAGTRALDLGNVYERFADHLSSREYYGESVERYEEGFQVFIGLAVCLLLAIGLSGDFALLRHGASAIVLLISLTQGAAGQTDAFASSLDHINASEYQTAADILQTVEQYSDLPPAFLYNAGYAHYRQGDFAKALDYFTRSLDKVPDKKSQERLMHNIGTTCYKLSSEVGATNRWQGMEYCRIGARHLEAALDINPKRSGTMINLEMIRKQMMAFREADKAEDHYQDALEALSRDIRKLINRQSSAMDDGGKLDANNASEEFVSLLTDKQQSIERDILKAEKTAGNITTPASLSFEENEAPQGIAARHLTAAADYARQALPPISRRDQTLTVLNQGKALTELTRAIAALPSDDGNQTQDPSSEGETDPGNEPEFGEGEDGEGEFEEGEFEYSGDELPPSSAQSAMRMDVENQLLPPPNVTPQDLLDREAAINELRAEKRSGRSSKVKMDW